MKTKFPSLLCCCVLSGGDTNFFDLAVTFPSSIPEVIGKIECMNNKREKMSFLLILKSRAKI